VQRPNDLPDGVMFDEEALKPLSPMALTDILQRHLDLVWEYAEAGAGGSGDVLSEAGEKRPLTLEPGCCDLRLAQLNEMLSLGAIVAIEQWTTEMLEEHPEHAAVWAEIRRRAASVDLAGLRALAARLQPAESNGRPREPAGNAPGLH
jgi:hypothetical protein